MFFCVYRIRGNQRVYVKKPSERRWRFVAPVRKEIRVRVKGKWNKVRVNKGRWKVLVHRRRLPLRITPTRIGIIKRGKWILLGQRGRRRGVRRRRRRRRLIRRKRRYRRRRRRKRRQRRRRRRQQKRRRRRRIRRLRRRSRLSRIRVYVRGRRYTVIRRRRHLEILYRRRLRSLR